MDMMKRKVLFWLVLNLSPFLLLYIISLNFLPHFYLFKWTADRFYLFVWIGSIYLVWTQKYAFASIITLGNLLGVLLGQFWGDKIREANIQLITEGMKPEQTAVLYQHLGFKIWLLTIFISIIISGVVTIAYTKMKNCNSTKR